MTEEKKQLRSGWSTGVCSAAAAKAAVQALIQQKTISEIEVTLPMGKKHIFKVESCRYGNEDATCSVVKDAGDDPDCTNGAHLTVTVSRLEKPSEILLERGPGVAVITKPGLGLEIGKPAINPVPYKNITEMVKEAAGETLKTNGYKVIISVPGGEEMAKKTQNERLGIMGGISILGNTGIVVPFSTSAYKASIFQGIDVAKASGQNVVVLTTGGRSEQFAMKITGLPEDAFVQMGDFVGYSVKESAMKGMRKVIICGMPGKMSKIAAGKMQTHAAGSQVDMTHLASIAKECGADPGAIKDILAANTARHVEEIVRAYALTHFWEIVARKVCESCRKHAGDKIAVECILTDFDGNILGRTEIK